MVDIWQLLVTLFLVALLSYYVRQMAKTREDLQKLGPGGFTANPSELMRATSGEAPETPLSPMSQTFKIVIYYATQTGISESFARQLSQELCLKGFNAQFEDCAFITPEVFKTNRVCVFFCSTTGEGEAPDNAKEFFRWLKTSELSLAHLQFSLFGLGNSSYEYFNYFAKDLEKQLLKKGATHFHPSHFGDENLVLEDEFDKWKQNLGHSLKKAVASARYKDSVAVKQAAAAHPRSPGSSALSRFQNYSMPNGQHQRKPSLTSPEIIDQILERSMLVKVEDIVEMKEDADRHCLHIELGTEAYSEAGELTHAFQYNAAETLCIFPHIDAALIAQLCALQGYDPNEKISAKMGAEEEDSDLQLLQSLELKQMTIGQALETEFDLQGCIRRNAIKRVMMYATNGPEQNELQEIAQSEALFVSKIQRFSYGVLDLLIHYPSIKMPFAVLAQLFPRLKHRQYSISSSPKVKPTRMCFAASLVMVTENNTELQHRYGVCSGYFYRLWQEFKQGHKPLMRVYLKDSPYKLPWQKVGSDKVLPPLLMIGPGTGLAPFIAVLQEIEDYMKKGTLIKEHPIVVVHGCRNRYEIIYRSELERMLKAEPEDPNGPGPEEHEYPAPPDSTGTVIDKAFICYSRQGTKTYVQEVVKKQGNRMMNLLLNGHGLIYVCGSRLMMKQIKSVLEDIAEEFMGSRDQAHQFVKSLNDEGRFLKEIWA